MRHNMAHRKLNRNTNQRKALLSGLAVSLIEKEKIMTTLPRAKEIRPFVERLITKGKTKFPTQAYQLIYRVLKHKVASQKIISVVAPRCKQRQGGYIRIIKAGYRYGDQAPMAIVEFVDKIPV